MTPARRKFLELLRSGPKLRVQLDASRSRIPRQLVREGLARVCEHPTVKDSFGYPAAAYELTAGGRKALEDLTL